MRRPGPLLPALGALAAAGAWAAWSVRWDRLAIALFVVVLIIGEVVFLQERRQRAQA